MHMKIARVKTSKNLVIMCMDDLSFEVFHTGEVGDVFAGMMSCTDQHGVIGLFGHLPRSKVLKHKSSKYSNIQTFKVQHPDYNNSPSHQVAVSGGSGIHTSFRAR